MQRGLALVWVCSTLSIAGGSIGCGSDDDGGSGGAAGATGGSGGNTGGTGTGGTSGSGASGATGGTGGGTGTCKGPGESCTAGEACNVWICRCQNTTVDLNTIGSCDEGSCSTGDEACGNICANSGGIKEAVNPGCSL